MKFGDLLQNVRARYFTAEVNHTTDQSLLRAVDGKESVACEPERPLRHNMPDSAIGLIGVKTDGQPFRLRHFWLTSKMSHAKNNLTKTEQARIRVGSGAWLGALDSQLL